MKLGSIVATDAVQAVLLEIDLVELLLQPADFGRVFAELGLQRRALGLDLLDFEVQLVQPLSLGLDLFLLLADAFGIPFPCVFERVAVDVVRRLGELRGLVRAEQTAVHFGEPVVHVVDALAIAFHRLLRRAELVCAAR